MDALLPVGLVVFVVISFIVESYLLRTLRHGLREWRSHTFSLYFLGVFVLLVCSYLARPLRAQDSTKQISYEGQNVGTVNLVARPIVDVESLRDLITQKAGEPYSNDKVQSTIAALQRTGQFSKVDIEVTPKPEGLQLMFVLRPAYYIGIISFPGGAKAFSFPQLFNVVNYPAQEPYEESRVKAAEPALKRFLALNGYFTAEVKAETKLDEARKLADVSFRITLHKRAKFGRFDITGLPPDEAVKLERSVHSFKARLKGGSVNTGKPYDPSRLREALNIVRNQLGDGGRLASQVRFIPPNFHPETNRADVGFQVTAGPMVSVKASGAKVSKATLKKLIPIYEENAFDRDLVEEGKRNLLSHFQTQGYYDATVDPQIDEQPSQLSVIYQISLGSKHKVAQVNIAGNHRIAAADLKGQIVVEKGGLLSHGKYSQDLLKRSVNNLTAYYQNSGYADVKVQPESVSRDHTVDVTFEVAEGDQTLVDSFRIDGNQTQSIEHLAGNGLKLRPGQPYSRALLAADRSLIVASYLNLGYLNVTFRSTVDPVSTSPPRVAVTYIVDEGPQVHISEVAYVGTEHTRTSFLRRNTTVRQGEPLSEGQMLKSESQLYNLGDFDWADVSPRKPITDQTEEDVLVRVHETKRNSLTYGVGFQSTSRTGSLSSGIVSLPGLPSIGLPKNFAVIQKSIFSPQVSFEYSRLNMRGLGETASVSTLLSTLVEKGTISYSIPQFEGLQWSSLWSVSGERNSMNPLFTAQSGLASFQMEKSLNAAKTKIFQFRYSFQRTSLSNLLIQNFVPVEDLRVRSSFVSASFIRDTRDKPLDAHKGFFETVDVRLNPKFIGSSNNFFRLFGQLSHYNQVAPWMVWANQVRVGVIKSFAGSHVPFGEQFFSGGAVSLRGFPLNGAGPQAIAFLCTKSNDPSTCTAQVTVPTGGHQLFVVNSEGRFPINTPFSFLKGLGGAIFYDGGNVYKHIGFSRFFSDYSNTVGFGLRYQTPVGPVRVDIGKNLNPVPGLKSVQIFVTLGQAF